MSNNKKTYKKKLIFQLNLLYRNYFKRLFDIIFSFIFLIILTPLMLVIAFLIRVKLGHPVIFKQKRPGKNEKIFEMYKFRSMTDEKDKYGNLLPDEKRLTSFGKKLRESSLDELPELFNILKGDMSFVGPRPQLVQDMLFMTPKQRQRHQVLPGLSGLAQINGRNEISWEEKLAWDLKYIQHISFRMDIVILLNTTKKVLLKENISSKGMETSENLGDYLLRTNKIKMDVYIKKVEISNQKYEEV